MDLKLLKMLCKDSKQHHVMFHEFYSVSSLLCIAQNVRFEIPYKVLYFETPFLMIFKYYTWASYGVKCYRGIPIQTLLERLGCDSVETYQRAWGMVEVQQGCFWLIDCTSLQCYEFPKLRFVKRNSMSKFSPRKEDNTS